MNTEKLNRIKDLHNDSINSFVDGDDIDWLIEQVELYEKAFEGIKEYLKEEIKRQEGNWGYDDHSYTVSDILDKVKELIKGEEDGE